MILGTKNTKFPVTCSAIYPSRLFEFELQSFGEIGSWCSLLYFILHRRKTETFSVSWGCKHYEVLPGSLMSRCTLLFCAATRKENSSYFKLLLFGTLSIRSHLVPLRQREGRHLLPICIKFIFRFSGDCPLKKKNGDGRLLLALLKHVIVSLQYLAGM